MELTPLQMINNSAPEKKKLSKMQQAIKDYKDEYLTGLTDEELESIKKEIQAFMEKEKEKGKSDSTPEQLSNQIKALLKKYGYKGDIDAYAMQLFDESQASQKELPYKNAKTLSSAEIAYNKTNHLFPYKENEDGLYTE